MDEFNRKTQLNEIELNAAAADRASASRPVASSAQSMPTLAVLGQSARYWSRK